MHCWVEIYIGWSSVQSKLCVYVWYAVHMWHGCVYVCCCMYALHYAVHECEHVSCVSCVSCVYVSMYMCAYVWACIMCIMCVCELLPYRQVNYLCNDANWKEKTDQAVLGGAPWQVKLKSN